MDFDIYRTADEIPLPGEIQKRQTTQTLTEPQEVNTIKYLEKRVRTKKNRFQTIMNMNVSYSAQVQDQPGSHEP